MKRFIGPVVIVIVTVSLIAIWFRSGLLIGGAENGHLLMRPDRFFDSIRYLWSANEGTGVALPNLFPAISLYYVASFLFKNGLSAVNIQVILFGLLLLTGGLSTYFLTTTLLKIPRQTTNHQPLTTNYQLAGLLSALFYMLNPYAMTMVWHRFLYPTMFTYASLPLVLLLFIKGLNERKIYYSLVIGVVSVIFSFTYGHPAFITVFWLPPFTYSLFYLYLNRHSRENILYAGKFFGATFVFWVLINLWWILPFSKVISAVGSQYISEPAKVSVRPSRQHSLYYLVRLLNPFYFFEIKSWGPIYSSFIFQAISWVIPIIVLVGVALNIKNRFVQYFALLSVFGLFLAKGANPPWGDLMISLFKAFPPMIIFRDFFGRFGIILPLGYAFLFGLGLSSVFYEIRSSAWLRARFIKSQIAILLLVGAFLGGISLIVFVVYMWPMWTGDVFKSQVSDLRVKVPVYYEQADNWLNWQKGDFRLLHLPLVSEGIIYNWEHKYDGIEPSGILFGKASISKYSFPTDFVAELLTRSDKYLNTQRLWRLMTLLGVRFVILHNDLDFQAMKERQMRIRSPGEAEEILRQIEKLDIASQTELMPLNAFGEPMGWELFWGDAKRTKGEWENFDQVGMNPVLSVEGYPDRTYYGWAYNLPGDKRDWLDQDYLVIWIKSSIPIKALYLEIDDEDGNGQSWDGRADLEYSIAAYEINTWKRLVMPLNRPTSKPPKALDFKRIKSVSIASGTMKPKKKIMLKIGSVAITSGSKVRNEGIRYARTFGKLDIYGLEEKYFLGHVYATNQYVQTRDFRTFFEDVERDSFIPREQIMFLKSQVGTVKVKSARALYRPEIAFGRINSSKYIVRVSNATQPYFLVFSETYDPGWKAYVDGKEVKNHYIANGYANAYYIDKKGTHKITLEYTPTRLLGTGAKISIISFLIAVLGLTGWQFVSWRARV